MDKFDDKTPPGGGREHTLVSVGQTAQRSVDLGLENRGMIKAMTERLDRALQPITMAWYERAVLLGAGLALIVACLAVAHDAFAR